MAEWRNRSDGLVIYIDRVATALSIDFNWTGLPSQLLAIYRGPNSNRKQISSPRDKRAKLSIGKHYVPMRR
ncbi:hypothetical protein J6590_086603 [Homalodisca vitripennis]|nr:hypothetical protein J6590_086603 [Homalodisca vitripennis]